MFDWLSSSNFMPHGHCYLWRPELLWLHVSSDGLIAAAYFAIPAMLVAFVIRTGKTLPFSWLFLLFGLFIVACGTTHLIEIANVWKTHYFLAGVVKALTAIVSVLTAIETYRILPRVIDVLREAESR